MLSVIYIVLVGVLFIIGYFTNVKLHKHILAIILSWLIIILPVVLWLVWAKNNDLAIINGSGLSLALLIATKLLFISTLAVFVWGWIKKFVLDFQISSIWPLLVIYVFIALAFAGLLFRNDNALDLAFYSFIVGAVIISFSRLIYSLRFWVFELAALALFTIVTFVNYLLFQGNFFDQFNVSNLLFGFSFIGLFIVVFNWFDEKWSTSYATSDNVDLPAEKYKSSNYSFIKETSKTNYVNTNGSSGTSANFKKSQQKSRVTIRPSTKLAATIYELRNRPRKDYTIQESYFKMPSFNFEQQPHQKKSNS